MGRGSGCIARHCMLCWIVQWATRALHDISAWWVANSMDVTGRSLERVSDNYHDRSQVLTSDTAVFFKVHLFSMVDVSKLNTVIVFALAKKVAAIC